MTRFRWIALALIGCAACSSDDIAPHGTLYYAISAPLCSSTVPAQFLVDGVVVGTDTFRVNLSPSHTMSAGFPIVTGSHTIGARLGSGGTYLSWPGAPDTVVTLNADVALTRVLPLTCS